MCGIVGIVSNKSVSSSIISALKKLEYRGYDSAGISTLSNGHIDEKKCSGRVDNLEKILFQNPSNGDLGIGHVRWATHGIPNQINAHPHSSDVVSVVHNGIIENSDNLRNEFKNKGYSFKSQTDTEVITIMLTDFLKTDNLINHHFVPLALDEGTDEETNIITLCEKHHHFIHKMESKLNVKHLIKIAKQKRVDAGHFMGGLGLVHQL